VEKNVQARLPLRPRHDHASEERETMILNISNFEMLLFCITWWVLAIIAVVWTCWLAGKDAK
jgi:hypothetical protein